MEKKIYTIQVFDNDILTSQTPICYEDYQNALNAFNNIVNKSKNDDAFMSHFKVVTDHNGMFYCVSENNDKYLVSLCTMIVIESTDEYIKDKLETELTGAKYSVSMVEDIIQEITGNKGELYDTNIDDGVNDYDAEDRYVMKSSFTIENGAFNIHVYYGDVTNEIGYVTFTE